MCYGLGCDYEDMYTGECTLKGNIFPEDSKCLEELEEKEE